MIEVKSVLDIEKHGYSIKEIKDGLTVYSKFQEKAEIEVWAFDNSISIDVVTDKSRMPIASRYIVNTQSELDFLLTQSSRLQF